MKELKVIEKNILDIKKGVIIHQVNNSGSMDEGITKQIVTKYPEHYDDYIRAGMFMGTIVITAINDDLGIMGFIAQDSFGTNRLHTDYQSFEMCLERLRRIHSCDETIEFYMPVKIGCGLAGGDWNIIYKMILDICPFVILVK